MKAQAGNAYRIYGKIGDMNRMLAVSGSGYFVGNLIYAMIYTCRTQEDADKLNAHVCNLQEDNGGTWEVRKVNGWL